MRRFSEKAVAAVAFVTALGGSLIAFPLLLDGQAFALDAKGTADAQPPEHHFPLPSEMVEPRLAFAKTALKITDTQTKQWNAVADVIRKQAKDRDARVTAMRAYRDTKFTLVDRMEQREKALTQQAADLAELTAAIKPLYAVLSDDQKETANHLLMHGMGHGEHGRFGHGGWHGGDGHGPRPDGAQGAAPAPSSAPN
jgi:hypothetical protein